MLQKKNETNKTEREKTYLLTCEPNEGSNQPAHPERRSFMRKYLNVCFVV